MAGLNAPVTARDVQFAKGMTLHHQAALDMARAYQANPDARNGFLGLLNVDIMTDQTQEIALMRRAVAAYPGNPDAVQVDASMIHGMEGMGHGGGHAEHGGMPMPQAAPAGTPPRQAAPRVRRVVGTEPTRQVETAPHDHHEHMH
jgi:uncharacterized protein (DUF305 family)